MPTHVNKFGKLAVLAIAASLLLTLTSMAMANTDSSSDANTAQSNDAPQSQPEIRPPQGNAEAKPQTLPIVHGTGSNGFIPVWTSSKTIGAAPLTVDPLGDVSQARTAGGMVKAMLYFSGFNNGRIVSCFNSTLSGVAATTPPCGFAETKVGTGTYIIDFGFQVDDRFYSLTNTNWFATSGLCTDWNGACSSPPSLTPNQVEVFTFLPEPAYNTYADTKFYLFVY